MKVWRAEATCYGADRGYVMKWFASEEAAKKWLVRQHEPLAPKIEESVVPDDVVGFLQWLNHFAEVGD